MGTGIPCKVTNRIRCKNCGKVLKIGDLVPERIKPSSQAGRENNNMQMKCYYCLCDDMSVIAYDLGDGNLLLTNFAQAELING